MRTDNRSLVFATLGGLCTAMACTLITDVDRQKILPPGSEGGQGASGGTSGRGGAGGTSGKGGGGSGGSTAGSAGTTQGGQSGEAGEGGAPATGGTSGTAGTTATGGTAGTSVAAGGAGGESGAPAECGNGVQESGEACDDGNTLTCGTCAADCSTVRVIPTAADASITIGTGANIADGDTITISDGTITATFEFECDPLADCPGATDGVGSGNVEVPFNATNFADPASYRDLLIAAIDSSSLATIATDGGSTPAMVALTNVENISDTVGAPELVAVARCRPNRGCSGDNVCLSNSCTAGTCD